MNEEIKEILEGLDKIAKGDYYPEDLLYYENCKVLLDYITNLQEKYNDLLEIHKIENNDIQELQQEMKKLNDIIAKDRQFYKCRMDEYAELKKENEKLQTTANNCKQENEILRKNAEHNDKVVDKARWNEMIYKSRCEQMEKELELWKKKYGKI